MKKINLIVGCLFILFASGNLFAQTVSTGAGKGKIVSAVVYQDTSTGTIRTVEISCDNSSNEDCYQVEKVQGYQGPSLELGYKNPVTNFNEKIKMKEIIDIKTYTSMGNITDVIRYVEYTEK